MNNEVAAYDVQFTSPDDGVLTRLVLARNAETAVGVVRGSFPDANINSVIRMWGGDEVLIDSAISIRKLNSEEEQDQEEEES